MKNRKFCIFLVIALFNCAFANDPQVETSFGPIQGVWFKTARAADIAGFLGIPYAVPPTEEFRFEVIR